jgi:hypothetical protein
LPPAAPHCGAIGIEATSLPLITPHCETTSICRPLTATLSRTCWSSGPLCATYRAYSGAAAHAATTTKKKKSPRAANAK